MKEQLPAPNFDRKQYERPVSDWVCGHSEEGNPCRLGPSARGRCQAAFECRPALQVKEGHTKGRYQCTRPKDFGGPCEGGPLPDGSCCRPIPKCSPIRTLRSKRGLVSVYLVALTVGVLLVALGGPWRSQFVNPGGLSSAHSGVAFSRKAGDTNGFQGCSGCHRAAAGGISGWVDAAFTADPGPFHLRQLSSTHPANLSGIDASCVHCHDQVLRAETKVDHTFHQPNVDENVSCSACHREHIGAGPMHPTAWANCVTCHGDAGRMQHFAERGKGNPAAEFARRFASGLNLFSTPRPPEGYTKVVHSFAIDHPDFQIRREGWRETNQLRFNHQFHLNERNVQTNLSCASCHQPDASGAFHRQITFAANCSGCHAMQFDQNNPSLTVPHGNPAFIRAFLRSLNTQYANHARRTQGAMDKERLNAYVQEQLNGLRQQTGSGEILEEKIFFSNKRWGPAERVGRLPGTGRSLFYGCAYCHEVSRAGDAVPVVTRPIIPDRWMLHSTFNHAKHTEVACIKCHEVQKSSDTADIIMPSKGDCSTCHSPRGGVSESCMTCHNYHRQPPGKTLDTVASSGAASRRDAGK